MSTRFLLVIILMLSTALLAQAKKEKSQELDLVAWASEQSSNSPEEVDGVKIFRANSIDADGKARITGFIDLPQIAATYGFTAALLYVTDNMDYVTDEISSVDFDNKRFIVERIVTEGEGKNAFSVAYSTAYQFADEMMTFVTYDALIEYKEKGIIPRKLAMDKFKPSTNERHSEILESFFRKNSDIVYNMGEYASQNPNIEISHWSDIKAGKVVKGMTPDEVKLIGGQPRSINESGSRSQWMFTNDFIVIFTDGLVTNVIQ